MEFTAEYSFVASRIGDHYHVDLDSTDSSSHF